MFIKGWNIGRLRSRRNRFGGWNAWDNPTLAFGMVGVEILAECRGTTIFVHQIYYSVALSKYLIWSNYLPN